MPAKKETGEGMNVDIKLVRDLAAILEKAGLTEIEVEDGHRKIKVARGGGTFVSAPAPMAPVPAPAAPAAEPAAAPVDDHAGAQKSPMVGTAYLAAEPGADNQRRRQGCGWRHLADRRGDESDEPDYRRNGRYGQGHSGRKRPAD